jgi:hypothetical protein
MAHPSHIYSFIHSFIAATIYKGKLFLYNLAVLTGPQLFYMRKNELAL